MKEVKNNPKVDLFAAFGKDVDPLPGTQVSVGEAYIGGACKKGYDMGDNKVPLWTGTSFNEWAKTPAASAVVLRIVIIIFNGLSYKSYVDF